MKKIRKDRMMYKEVNTGIHIHVLNDDLLPDNAELSQPSGKILKTLPNKPLVLRVRNKSLLKTLWEKEKLLTMINFSSVSHISFFSFRELSTNFIKFLIIFCKVHSTSELNRVNIVYKSYKICRLGEG